MSRPWRCSISEGLLHSSRAVVFWALTVTCLTVHFGALAKVMCFESLFFGGRKLVALNWGSFEGMNCMLQHEMKRSLTGLWSHF